MKSLDIDAWIESGDTPAARDFRRAVHIVLTAISSSPTLPGQLIMKGGILLAIAHRGNRYTRDIDFSMVETISELPKEQLEQELRDYLPQAVEKLEYDLDCRIQSVNLKPPGEDKHFQTLILNVGYARFSDTKVHTRLMNQGSPNTVKVECSYNEKIVLLETLNIPPELSLKAYSIEDVIAEKYRALIQQPSRNRYRRQDVYDIQRILSDPDTRKTLEHGAILDALKLKTEARNLCVDQQSLEEPEIYRRAEENYAGLELELGKSPVFFKHAFAEIKKFYKDLPW